MSSNREPATVEFAESAAGGGGSNLNRESSIETPNLQTLESQLDELIRICQRLRDENVALKSQQSNLLVERAHLIERSELARSRVEAMIARLKAMESGS